MSEAKYKVGDEVQYDGCKDVAEVVAVRVAGYVYDLKWRPGNVIQGYRECSLVPYVRPLAVGDRVRHKYTQKEIGEVVGIRDGRACIWCDLDDDGDYDWNSYAVESLIRIPAEAGK